MPASNSRDTRQSEAVGNGRTPAGSGARLVNEKRKEPLRGDAAWRAEVKEIARRNELACAAGARERAANEKRLVREAAERDRRETKQLRGAVHR
jgi:hypothetical protein